VKFLRNVIYVAAIRVDPKKVIAILNWKQLADVIEVYSFLDMT